MARKSRYLGYAKGVLKIGKNKKRRTSTKESVLTRLKKLRDKDFSMTIPVAEGNPDEH
ncbi:MAG: hypothetical protein SOY47_13875 [Lachnospiraceae bacterium]|nr:hypothetical protein [Lachnospiraceae bacterium]